MVILRRKSANFITFRVTFIVLKLLQFSTASNLNTGGHFILHKSSVLESSCYLKYLRVTGPVQCGLVCLKNEECLSFNIAKEMDSSGLYECELLSVDLTTHLLTYNAAFHHYEFLLEHCRPNPCKNNGKCANINKLTYQCYCPPTFTSKNCEQEKWIQLNKTPRCFGSRDSKYSNITIDHTGVLLTMKLVRLSGHLTCDNSNANGWNYWGCASYSGDEIFMSTIVTDSSNKPLLPGKDVTTYNLPGYNITSTQIVYRKLSNPLQTVVGQQYRIWFGIDLKDISEFNNAGEVCVDVFGLYE